MLTVAAIAKLAFDGVASAVSDPIQACTITRLGNYTPGAGAAAPTTIGTGRCVFASIDAAKDEFPHLTIGPTDALVYVIETGAPLEGDTFTVGGITRSVIAVRDLLNAGSFWALLVR